MDQAQENRDYQLKILKGTDFNYNKACQLIEMIHIQSCDPKQHSSDHYFQSYFDFDQIQMIRATGGLLWFLLSHNLISTVANWHDKISIYSVRPLVIDGYMYIEPVALHSLQIFHQEDHPATLKASSKPKEGFSLYGVLNRTLSWPGCQLLREWMLKPLVDIPTLLQRYDVVEYLTTCPDHANLRKLLSVHLKRFRDVNRVSFRIKTATNRFRDWQNLHQSIANFLQMQTILKTHQQKGHEAQMPIPLLFQDICRIQRLEQLYNVIGNVIDFEQSQEQNEYVIQDGISSELDHLRLVYRNLDHTLEAVGTEIQQKYPDLASEEAKLTVQYIPQVGYVIQTSVEPSHMVEEEDLDYQFQSLEDQEVRYHYKSVSCKELDNDPGDISCNIQDIQSGILRQLVTTIFSSDGTQPNADTKLGYEKELHQMATAAAQLDCLLAFAKSAVELGYIRPEMLPMAGPNSATIIKNARHPLQELTTVNSYIPNDVRIGAATAAEPDVYPLLLLTGENGSGKSAYLKMVGLLHYMAQIGSFVPAKSAKIAPVAKLFARIQSVESASYHGSTFSIDCNQIASMLNCVDASSLVLIDEYGKGTYHPDGVGLLAATIEYLAQDTLQRNRCGGPRVVVTTHFLEIFQQQFLQEFISTAPDDQRPIGCFRMATSSSVAGTDDVLTHAPLYELQKGVASSSNAFRCASLAGIPDCVVERAQQIVQLRNSRQEIKALPSKEQAQQHEAMGKLLTKFMSITNWRDCPEVDLDELMSIARSISESAQDNEDEN